jgi:large subunit ribosomal protein L18
MVLKTTHMVPFRRKREGRTNYKRRLALLKGGIPRLVVRKTNQQLIAQVVSYEPDGDRVIAAVNGLSLKKHGWKYSCKNIPAAYLAGCLLGSVAKGKVDEVILDIGLHVPLKGSRLFAVAKGVSEFVKVRIAEDAFPSKERIAGDHIKKHYSEHKDRFTGYAKNRANPGTLDSEVERIKKAISKGV